MASSSSQGLLNPGVSCRSAEAIFGCDDGSRNNDNDEPIPGPSGRASHQSFKDREENVELSRDFENKKKELSSDKHKKGTKEKGTSKKGAAARPDVDKRKEEGHKHSNSKEGKEEVNLKDIKEQLDSLMQLVPVVAEMKKAYNAYLEDERKGQLEEKGHSDDDVEMDLIDEALVPVDLATEEKEETTGLGYFEEVVGTVEEEERNINERIANGITKVLAEGLAKDTSQRIGKKYPSPTNCERLQVMSCNPEVYKHCGAKAKHRDSFLQRIQDGLIHGITAVAKSLDYLISKEVETSRSNVDKDIKESLSDGLALLTNASHSLDVFRRHSFKEEIKAEYQSLCNGQYPVKGHLFGENISDRIKEVNETNKVAKTTKRFAAPRNHPYNQNRRQTNARRFPFLGQGQPWKSRGGGNNIQSRKQPAYIQGYKARKN